MYINESDGTQTRFLDDFDYDNLSMLGVKFKSMAQTQQLQAMQIWLEKGISVKKLTGTDGASDLLADIVYFLLTEPGRGMRNQIPEEMIDRPSFEHTNRFLEANRLFYNGAITDQVNVRAYINQIAPFFLCHLSIRAGKFFMTPAVPTDNAGVISNQPVPIAGYFNDGNIVDDGSFKLNVLDASERREFRCVVKYRDSVKNAMPQYKTIQMRYKDLPIQPDQQEFDVTQFVTTAEHAKMAARYLLASRRRVDHTVEFSTSPFGIALAPGDYIKVETVSSPLETRISGRINDELQVMGNVADGTHTATIYRQAADSVVTEEIVIANGRVADQSLRNSLFAIPLLERRLGVYMIEELALDEEGMVQVKASHHPVNDSGVSRIALDLLARGMMTASPLSTDIYDQVNPESPFDIYRPTTRQFTSGSFPVKTFQAQNGAEIRILYGNQLTGKKLNLTYANVTDAVAYHFIQHYVEMRGSYKTFTMQDKTMTVIGQAGKAHARALAHRCGGWIIAMPRNRRSNRCISTDLLCPYR